MDPAGRPGIFVLGMHRSGTSAVTRLLGLAGGVLPRDPLPATTENPAGYWESQRIVRLNNQLLASAGTAWSDPAAIPESWFSDPARGAEAGQIAALVGEVFPPAGVVICKDPRICRLLPLWQRGCYEAGIRAGAVLVLRDPPEVAASLAARADHPAFRPAAVGSKARSLVLWLRYVLDAERYSRSLPRQVVHYAAMLADWRAGLEGVFAAGMIPRPDPDTAAQIDAFLDPGLRHHGGPPGDGDGIARPAADLCGDVQETVVRSVTGCTTAATRCDEWRTRLDELLAEQESGPASADPRAAFDPVAEAVLAGLASRWCPRVRWFP